MSQSFTWLILYSDKSCPGTMYKTLQNISRNWTIINKVTQVEIWQKCIISKKSSAHFTSRNISHEDNIQLLLLHEIRKIRS